MGWKSTAYVSRLEAIDLLTKHLAEFHSYTNEELEDLMGNTFGDTPGLPYYGYNFIVNDNGNKED